ncbi:MAG: hypothetical protein HEP71_21170 [Roseivirga sp.]|nr:hypothetical protein [Roseivirga sp.]
MRLIRLLNKLNWKIYLMELIIVIVGITIAYQVNIYYEKGLNRQLELTAIENLRKENQINLEEFSSLEAYRKRISSETRSIFRLLGEKNVRKDSLEAHLFYLVQTATPDLQQEASNFYLNSNYSNTNLELKNELLTLKTYLQELMSLSNGYQQSKSEDFFKFLRNAVDFPARKIVNMDKLTSLEFKNIIWNQGSDEIELNRLYKQAVEKLVEVQDLVEQILKDAE